MMVLFTSNDSVVLHVKTHGFKFKEGNNHVSIITRFAYKSMTTNVGSGALCTSLKAETILFNQTQSISPTLSSLRKSYGKKLNFHIHGISPMLF